MLQRLLMLQGLLVQGPLQLLHLLLQQYQLAPVPLALVSGCQIRRVVLILQLPGQLVERTDALFGGYLKGGGIGDGEVMAGVFGRRIEGRSALVE